MRFPVPSPRTRPTCRAGTGPLSSHTADKEADSTRLALHESLGNLKAIRPTEAINEIDACAEPDVFRPRASIASNSTPGALNPVQELKTMCDRLLVTTPILHSLLCCIDGQPWRMLFPKLLAWTHRWVAGLCLVVNASSLGSAPGQVLITPVVESCMVTPDDPTVCNPLAQEINVFLALRPLERFPALGNKFISRAGGEAFHRRTGRHQSNETAQRGYAMGAG